MTYLWVALGGGLGAAARYAIGAWMIPRSSGPFPFHTLLINVTGSLTIGLLLAFLAGRPQLDPAWRLFLVVGFLGGYTTFSSYSFELISLARAGQWTSAAWYLVASNALSLAACALGIAVAGLLSALRSP
ncbi:MAG TPA: fluoride efflux transporter CrcB [Chloroflexota bacterium]|nr:fluoride efflux transporter CrcB [Chloroflexota bacterium]